MSTEKSNKNHVFIYKESGDPNMRHSQPTDCKERQTYWYKNWKTRTLEYLFSEQSVLEQVDENTNRKKKDLKKVVDKVWVTVSTGFYGLFSNAEEKKSTYVGGASSRKNIR